jgi:hypothetical protein
LARQPQRNALKPPDEVDPRDDERETRIKLRVDFLVLAHRKGMEEALRLWNEAPPEEVLRLWSEAPPKRGRGRPRGSPNLVRDGELLAYYDVLRKEDPSLNPTTIGRLLYGAFGRSEYGSTEGGVRQQIRRLLKRRSDSLSNPNRLLVKRPDTPSTTNRLHPDRRDK